MRTIKTLTMGAFLAVAVAATSIVAAAQTQTSAKAQAKKMPDVTVTGCLIQGTGPSAFVLDNARVDPKDANEPAKKYAIVSAVEDMPLKNLVNHEVTATGAVEMKRTDVKPATTPPTESELPVLTARALSPISDRCTDSAGR